MNLRQKIKRLIDESQGYDDASKLICVMLNYELDLERNDWFEDDPDLEELLEDNELWDRVELILAS